MKEASHQWKVGVFVLIGLTVLAGLMLNFSRGIDMFQDRIIVKLKTTNVGAIKNKAAVLMAGIQVGTVDHAELAKDGKSVTIFLKIDPQYPIYSDSRFLIDSMGFLGDHFISIRPTLNEGKILKEGDEVIGQEPFDFQEVGRASMGFIQRLDGIAQTLNQTILKINNQVLNEQTITNFGHTIANFRTASERAVSAVDGLERLFTTNAAPVSIALSNMVEFSVELNKLADELTLTVSTNQGELTAAVHNFKVGSETIRSILNEVNAGKGLIGGLVKDEQMKFEMFQLVNNFTLLSSNMNRYGLLYKPKKPKASEDQTAPMYEGKRFR